MLLPGWGLAGNENGKPGVEEELKVRREGSLITSALKVGFPPPRPYCFSLVKTGFAGLGKGTENSIPSPCSGNDHWTNTPIQIIFVTLQNFGLNLLLLMGRNLYLFHMAFLKSTDLTN